MTNAQKKSSTVVSIDRSHAVLEITVNRKQSNKYPNQVIKGKLALVDLAGRSASLPDPLLSYSSLPA